MFGSMRNGKEGGARQAPPPKLPRDLKGRFLTARTDVQRGGGGGGGPQRTQQARTWTGVRGCGSAACPAPGLHCLQRGRGEWPGRARSTRSRQHTQQAHKRLCRHLMLPCPFTCCRAGVLCVQRGGAGAAGNGPQAAPQVRHQAHRAAHPHRHLVQLQGRVRGRSDGKSLPLERMVGRASGNRPGESVKRTVVSWGGLGAQPPPRPEGGGPWQEINGSAARREGRGETRGLSPPPHAAPET